MSQLQTTVSTPFVYLRPKNRRDIAPKKVLMGCSVRSLLKNANKLFKNLGTVKAIYTEAGELVKDMEQLIPTAVYYVSSVDPDMEQIYSPIMKEKQEKSQQQQASPNVNKAAFTKLFGHGNVFSQDRVDEIKRQLQQEKEEEERRKEQARKEKLEQRNRMRQQRKEAKERRRLERQKELEEAQNAKHRAEEEEANEQSDSEADREFEETERRIHEEEEEEQDDNKSVRSNRSNRSRRSTVAGGTGEEEEYEEEEEQDDNKSVRSNRSNRSRRSTVAGANGENEEEEDYEYSYYYSDEEDDAAARAEQFSDRVSDKYSERKSEAGASDVAAASEPEDDESQTDTNIHRTENINKILRELIGEDSLESRVAKTLVMFKDHVAKFIGTSPELESLQQENWLRLVFTEIKKQFTLEYDDIMLKQKLTERAKQVIREHRFITSTCDQYNNATYAMRLAVVGPRHSGKSTFLTVLSQQLLSELIATGEWKKTLVFYANLQTIQSFCTSIEGLFQTIVDLTVDALLIQRPTHLHIISQLKRYLNIETILQKTHTKSKNAKQRTSGKPPRFVLMKKASPTNSKAKDKNDYVTSMKDESTIVKKVTAIGSKLWTLYNDSDKSSITAFLTQLFMLPHELSAVFGFRQVFFLLDNFEYSAFELRPSFSQAGDRTLVIGEYWKFMVDKSSFIVSCENEVDFYNRLEPLEEDSVDLTRGISYVSTLGMIEDADDDIAIKVFIDGQRTPFILTRDHCGGCAAFTKLWIELNDEFDTYDQMMSDDSTPADDISKEEKRLELVSQTQQFIDDLFFNNSRIDENYQKENEILVVAVKRDPRNE